MDPKPPTSPTPGHDSEDEHTVVAEPTGLARVDESGAEQQPEPIPAPGVGTELRSRFRYRLIKRLGGGAFGSVFFARCLDHDPRRDDSPPSRVAIKILGASPIVE